jgi:hypothetical protein
MLRKHEYLIANSIKPVLIFGVIILFRRCFTPLPDFLMNLKRVTYNKPARFKRLAFCDLIFDQKVKAKFRLLFITYFKRGHSR